MYKSWSKLIILVFGVCFTTKGLTEQCIPIEGYASCACKLNETENVINLQPLAPKKASDRPRFTVNGTGLQQENWHFSYNPCDGFDMFLGINRSSPCKNVAVARWTTSPPKQCQDVGDPKSAAFDYHFTNLIKFNSTLMSNLTLTFTSLYDTKLKNMAVIFLVCKPNMTLNESNFQFLTVENKVHSTYYFSLESKCACPGLCGTPPHKKGPSKKSKSDDQWIIIGVSIGAVVLLLLVILAVICCRTKRSGYTSI